MTNSSFSLPAPLGRAPALPAVLADLIPGARVRDAALVIGGAALTGVAAQVSIHISLTPVPFTLGTMAVLLVGAALGPWRGMASLAIYAIAGSLGVPWFANQAHGWAYAPSFGYILGYIAAAGLVGALARRGADRRVLSTMMVMVLGDAVLLLIGTAWLAASLHVSLRQGYLWGVQPFVVGDLIKLSVAALVLPGAWRIVRR